MENELLSKIEGPWDDMKMHKNNATKCEQDEP